MKSIIYLPILFGLLQCLSQKTSAQVEQIVIERVELMPNEPSPYFMRDWKRVAMGYDSMVYDLQKTGEHFPFVFTEPAGHNYPENPSFGLDTYVGTFSNDNGEAINVLPSLVGATLVGINKTNQFGHNWILMSQDYFNKNNGELLYLNNIGGHSGSDWWYDMMPNIFFYQLYDLYGNIGNASNQFHHVADRMAGAVKGMGGSNTPWSRAFMDYRAWKFLDMEPNADGVHEPEAAGAYAWLLYHAYKETDNLNYLQAAEWSMEYLNNLGTNPSYELQLPYGAYVAAKMNAEIGTEYNIEKLVFWIFNRGPLRGWGTIVGTWNTFDVSGLVGEANDGGNDYAFQLNGLHQAAALVPLVRYDKRFSRTLGKWMLNVANATRFMYPGYLPSHLQDADAWSDANDPQAVMGYEALREQWQGSSPFSTGDAFKGGWAASNLSLYSTSSIGYLGSLIEKTNEEKILRLDLVKTDFFGDTAYPSFLLYNPFATTKTVSIDAGTGAKDIYDVVSETFLAQNVTGETSIHIPADQAVSIVLAPAGGTISFDNNKMLIDGVIVDFMQTVQPYNYPPRIQSFATQSNTVEKNTEITLYAKGIDQETKDLVYTFYLPEDTISGLEKTATWTAPDEEGVFVITLIAEDEDNLQDTAILEITVVEEINISPEIISLTASNKYTALGGSIDLTAQVVDANGDPITYEWSAEIGDILGTGSDVEWVAPFTLGIYTMRLTVTDGRGGVHSKNIDLLVHDPALQQSGDLIAWYPFSGSAFDFSGNNLHGIISGPKLTTDSLGNPNEAYWFDGINDHIRVLHDIELNFYAGITVSLFTQPLMTGDKERFFISHGSWQNRWKLSITPDKKVRWTIKNEMGQVRDLDSETVIEDGKFYHVGATYDGIFMMLYINGRLESFTGFSDLINESLLALEIGQMLPDDPSYNFNGVLDEIKIFNYALHPDSIAKESGHISTGVFNPLAKEAIDIQLYPNPADESITISMDDKETDFDPAGTLMTIFDAMGMEVWKGHFGNTYNSTIDLSGFSAGIYLLNLYHRHEGVVIKRFVVE